MSYVYHPLRANMKYLSKTQGSLKLLDQIMIPYVEKERYIFNLDHCQLRLLIMDVFSEQIVKPVIDKWT